MKMTIHQHLCMKISLENMYIYTIVKLGFFFFTTRHWRKPLQVKRFCEKIDKCCQVIYYAVYRIKNK